MDIFTLEVIQAKHGDCLLLHYGSKNDPKTIVIDGGPAGVFKDNLLPRLREIKESLSPNAALPLAMVMVSHLDDDHVNGILRLMDHVADVERGRQKEFDIKDLWVNTFDDIIGNLQMPVLASLPASAAAADISKLPIPPETERSVSAIIASTAQGRQLRDAADKMACRINRPFRKYKENAPLVRGDSGRKAIDWQGLSITVLHPNEERLEKLQKQWDDDLKKAKDKGDDSIIFASITGKIRPDTSVFNLSSIVCLVEFGGKRILLTGDGRSDDIYEGLRLNNLLDEDGKIHIDILKFPHHGSIRNMMKPFLENVTADYYVISADGNYDNPDQALLDLFADTITKGTLYITNHDGKAGFGLKKKLDDFQKKLKNDGSKVKLIFGNGTPKAIDLLTAIDF